MMDKLAHAKSGNDATITKERAEQIASATIASLKSGLDLVILGDKTVERPFGWVFFYTTKKYLETKDPNDIMPGNSPLIVDRETGETHFLSTSAPPSRAIEEYERRWRERRGSE